MEIQNNKPENTSDNPEFAANDGMTAASARKTKHESDKAEHASEAYHPDEKPGSKFNINDQAYSQSSKADFVPTVSNFEHSDGTKPPAQIDSQHISPD